MIYPQHVAIIMDGNGRWAQLRRKPRTYGHIKGARVAKKIITFCAEKGLKNLTLYTFSSENWFRPEAEVFFLMNLLRRYLKRETETLVKQNIHFKAIGDLSKLPTDVLKAINEATLATANNTGLNLVFAISYGSRQEIADAVKIIAQQVESGKLKAEDVTEATIQRHLYTANTPDPDLIIRTSGEHRLSNFMLWQASYSEFHFCETLWPDFSPADFEVALRTFSQRERRFGAIHNNELSHH